MTGNRGFDGLPGPHAQPGLQHGSERTALGGGEGDQQHVLVLVADPLNVRAPAPGAAGCHPDPVGLAAVAEEAAVAGLTGGGDPLGDGLLAGEVAPDPGFALGRSTRARAAASPARTPGTVAITPRLGSIVTRRRRARDERRRV